MKQIFTIMVVALGALAVRAEEITLATYNIEHFKNHFLAHQLEDQPIAREPAGKEILSELRKKNDEDNWETAQVILEPKFNPDILVIEEGCGQSDLNYFNRRWLNGAYATAIQFPSNTDRQQNLDLLMKPGFKLLERRDQYHLEPDPVGNDRGSRLFARGPVFVKVQTPGGYRLWVGLTHMKSKNPGPVATPEPGMGTAAERKGREARELRQKKIADTQWRNREARRTHEIIKELEKAGPSDVILLGDMNDSLGMDAFEPEAGGDALANLVGPEKDGLILATRPLTGGSQYSFHGYWRTGFREMIDHIVVTRSMKDKLGEVRIVTNGLAGVASDHFPVMIRLKTK
ncbi:MAG TPA: endonuclease/exonuclease/phosphatase family protein [Candidatus Paceibacterota bacterium]|nr:endonuclease/exonuclease/phosphatase family protein [Verrucomicrobiota bacterium]HSA11536.1 endonuclease/exonuclease/phosphatase family protein [Candidatus Paceibacterota bacterium]